MAIINSKTGRILVATSIYLPVEVHAEAKALGMNRTRIAEKAIREEIARLKQQKKDTAGAGIAY